jgi:hypothetical protein
MGLEWCWWQVDDRQCLPTFKSRFMPGDHLWVREAWCHTWDAFDSDDPPSEPFMYRADEYPGDLEIRWKPSIHMPRRASRITLQITDVRVQRLQEISKEDVIAEGITERDGDDIKDVHAGWHEPFAKLWESINGKDSWAENPWIWAISFKRIEQQRAAA